MGVPPPPGGIYVALYGTNQIEATKLRVHSTNERAG